MANKNTRSMRRIARRNFRVDGAEATEFQRPRRGGVGGMETISVKIGFVRPPRRITKTVTPPLLVVEPS